MCILWRLCTKLHIEQLEIVMQKLKQYKSLCLLMCLLSINILAESHYSVHLSIAITKQLTIFETEVLLNCTKIGNNKMVLQVQAEKTLMHFQNPERK